MSYEFINSTKAWETVQALKGELALAKQELEEWEERDCLSEEARFEAANKCKNLRDEIEAIEEALEGMETYEQAMIYLELTWKQG